LPLALWRDEASQILKNILDCPEIKPCSDKAEPSRKSPAWDDSKVSDHHAIIPTREATPEKIASLPPREAQVFSLIARSFVMQFLPDHVFLARKAVVGVGSHRFAATGRSVLEAGWTMLRRGAQDAQEEGEDSSTGNVLPAMANGDPVQILDGTVDALKTEPPPAYTDGTLIRAMAKVHTLVKDPELKKRLRETDGIGTEATRAEIIETLLKRGFLKRQGKTTLLSTELGRAVVDAVPNDLADPGMTALWEGQLRRIEEGGLSDQDFLRALQASIAKRVEAAKTGDGAVIGVRIPHNTRTLDGSSSRKSFGHSGTSFGKSFSGNFKRR